PLMNALQGFGFVLPHWLYWGWLAVMPLILMVLTGGTRQAASAGDELPPGANETTPLSHEGNAFTRAIDWLSNASGIFVAFWTINAVVFYFYEVIMRYFFNMPTIWVHESSYLLFGMQYLLTGAFALLHGAHVRVDILYVKLPARGQAGMDILTSVIFFVFALAMVWTSWTFMLSSIGMKEVSLETWQIQYWPVKVVMFTGSVLILLAGMAKLVKDILLFRDLGTGEAA
ncbi:MAG TPA: TRAP transporter small permease subunit, partial [Thiolinea sp.]|nr:TRAP transporter small permease subunit [Thiolinea sp.]